MKKFIKSGLICAASFVSLSSYADKTITLTESGTRSGPVTTSPTGSVTANCGDDEARCYKVTITTSEGSGIASPGDPTTFETYVNNQIETSFSGGYVSYSDFLHADNTHTVSICLSNLQQN
jgi:hypothetical protein